MGSGSVLYELLIIDEAGSSHELWKTFEELESFFKALKSAIPDEASALPSFPKTKGGSHAMFRAEVVFDRRIELDIWLKAASKRSGITNWSGWKAFMTAWGPNPPPKAPTPVSSPPPSTDNSNVSSPSHSVPSTPPTSQGGAPPPTPAAPSSSSTTNHSTLGVVGGVVIGSPSHPRAMTGAAPLTPVGSPPQNIPPIRVSAPASTPAPSTSRAPPPPRSAQNMNRAGPPGGSAAVGGGSGPRRRSPQVPATPYGYRAPIVVPSPARPVPSRAESGTRRSAFPIGPGAAVPRAGPRTHTTQQGVQITVFANGSRKRAWPNGTEEVTFPSGDVTITYQDGTKLVVYAKTKTRFTTHPSGLQVYEYTNGQTKKIFPSGTREIHFGDGMTEYQYSNGDVKRLFPDGKMTYTFAKTGVVHTRLPNGTVIDVFKNGQTKKIRPDGSSVTIYPNGVVKTVDATGTSKVSRSRSPKFGTRHPALVTPPTSPHGSLSKADSQRLTAAAHAQTNRRSPAAAPPPVALGAAVPAKPPPTRRKSASKAPVMKAPTPKPAPLVRQQTQTEKMIALSTAMGTTISASMSVVANFPVNSLGAHDLSTKLKEEAAAKKAAKEAAAKEKADAEAAKKKSAPPVPLPPFSSDNEILSDNEMYHHPAKATPDSLTVHRKPTEPRLSPVPNYKSDDESTKAQDAATSRRMSAGHTDKKKMAAPPVPVAPRAAVVASDTMSTTAQRPEDMRSRGVDTTSNYSSEVSEVTSSLHSDATSMGDESLASETWSINPATHFQRGQRLGVTDVPPLTRQQTIFVHEGLPVEARPEFMDPDPDSGDDDIPSRSGSKARAAAAAAAAKKRQPSLSQVPVPTGAPPLSPTAQKEAEMAALRAQPPPPTPPPPAEEKKPLVRLDSVRSTLSSTSSVSSSTSSTIATVAMSSAPEEVRDAKPAPQEGNSMPPPAKVMLPPPGRRPSSALAEQLNAVKAANLAANVDMASTTPQRGQIRSMSSRRTSGLSMPLLKEPARAPLGADTKVWPIAKGTPCCHRLMDMLLKGHAQCLKLYAMHMDDIDERINIWTDHDRGSTLLHKAARASDKPELIKEIISHGANPRDVETAAGELALHWASAAGRHHVVEALLDEAPETVNAVNKKRRTAVHLAALNGHLECVRVLLQYDCNIDVVDDDHNTPIHVAAKAGKVDVVELLHINGASIDAHGEDNLSLLELAEQGGHDEAIAVIAELLGVASPVHHERAAVKSGSKDPSPASTRSGGSLKHAITEGHLLKHTPSAPAPPSTYKGKSMSGMQKQRKGGLSTPKVGGGPAAPASGSDPRLQHSMSLQDLSGAGHLSPTAADLAVHPEHMLNVGAATGVSELLRARRAARKSPRGGRSPSGSISSASEGGKPPSVASNK